MFLRSIKVVWFVLLSESPNVSHLPLICITSLPRIRLIVHYVSGKYVMYVNPKHEAIHKPLALCISLLTSIGPFSVPQAGYSSYAYSIHKQPCNRNHNKFFNFSDLEVFCNSVADWMNNRTPEFLKDLLKPFSTDCTMDLRGRKQISSTQAPYRCFQNLVSAISGDLEAVSWGGSKRRNFPLAPTNCPWVSQDAFLSTVGRTSNLR